MRVLGALAVLVAGAAAWTIVRAEGAPAGCDPQVSRDPLPAWARAGFTASEPRLPHVVGREGRIAAILFGHPLSSPPAPRRSNKILWVSRLDQRPGSDLRIRARRGGRVVTRVVDGGAGPSIVDLPAPGCWRLELRWSGHIDTLDLEYAPR